MKLHEVISKDVLRLIKVFVYIQVNTTNSSTSLCLGADEECEADFVSSSNSSILIFEEIQRWPEEVDLAELKQAIVAEKPELILELKKNQLTIAAKTPVTIPEDTETGFAPDSEEAKWMEDLFCHLNSFKRSIVAVAKKRYCCVCYEEEPEDRVFLDPIPLTRYNLAEARVFLDADGRYSEACVDLFDFCTTRHALECLDRDKFDIFILYEDDDIVTYEITNKTLLL